MELRSLKDLYLDEIKDLYSAEKQLVEALPKMASAAQTPEFQTALREHLEITKGQVSRLDQIFDEMGETPGDKQCKGMRGLIEEGQDLIGRQGEALLMDAGLVSAAQKVEHYEIAAYAAARTHAEMLGFEKAAELLEMTLEEEEMADNTLGDLAEDMDDALAPDYEGDITIVHFGSDSEDLEEDEEI